MDPLTKLEIYDRKLSEDRYRQKFLDANSPRSASEFFWRARFPFGRIARWIPAHKKEKYGMRPGIIPVDNPVKGAKYIAPTMELPWSWTMRGYYLLKTRNQRRPNYLECKAGKLDRLFRNGELLALTVAGCYAVASLISPDGSQTANVTSVTEEGVSYSSEDRARSEVVRKHSDNTLFVSCSEGGGEIAQDLTNRQLIRVGIGSIATHDARSFVDFTVDVSGNTTRLTSVADTVQPGDDLSREGTDFSFYVPGYDVLVTVPSAGSVDVSCN